MNIKGVGINPGQLVGKSLSALKDTDIFIHLPEDEQDEAYEDLLLEVQNYENGNNKQEGIQIEQQSGISSEEAG